MFTNFSTLSIPFSKVCGMEVGYQQSSTDGFQTSVKSINGPYVDGVSITYGNPRKHIWTYGIGHTSDQDPAAPFNCPCSQFPGPLPSFVQDIYYCESGTTQASSGLFTGDPVWDGEVCSSQNNCCSEPSLPWFYCQLPLTASDDIETRICRDEASSNEDVLVREFLLYVL